MFGPEREPESQNEWLLYVLFLCGLLGLFAAEIWFDYEPEKLAALFFLLFWMPLLVLHELGHALMAWLLGWHVSVIVLGMGRPLGGFYLGRTPVLVRLFPIEGFIRSAPQDLHWPQLKSALIYAAGPGVELLLALLIVLLVGSDTLFTFTDHIPLLLWQSLALAAVVGGVLNLLPHGIQTPGGFIPNDGLGILYSFLQPTEHFQRMLHRPAESLADWQTNE